jgi:hypothetical protein
MSDEGDPKGPGKGGADAPKPVESDGDADERARDIVKRAMKKARSEPKKESSRDSSEESESSSEENPGTVGPSKESKEDKDTSSKDAPVDDAIDEPPGFALDEVDLKDALRGALRPPEGAVAPKLLRGVQKKLRVRSRGKFYGDGWSTSESPKTTYLVTAIIMLALVAVLFFALIPWSTSSLP